MLAHVGFQLVFHVMYLSKAGSRGKVGSLIFLLSEPVHMGERIAIR